MEVSGKLHASAALSDNLAPGPQFNRSLSGAQTRFEVLGMMMIVNIHTMKAYGWMKVQLHPFPTWALHGKSSQLQASDISSRGKSPWNQLNRKLAGPQGRPGPSAEKTPTRVGKRTTYIVHPSLNTVTTPTATSGASDDIDDSSENNDNGIEFIVC